MPDTVILILNHVRDRHVMDLAREIHRDYGHASDVFLLTDRTQASLSMARCPAGVHEFGFTLSDLGALGYPRSADVASTRGGEQNFKHGHADLPVLLFHARHPGYRNYWLIEYDVRYSGNWNAFFASFADNEADLLGTSMLRAAQCPTWSHWHWLQLPDESTTRYERIRGFFPVYRISARALLALDSTYRRDFQGHMEALVPTLLHHQGFTLEDIGGDGEFVRPENRNRYYCNDPSTNSLGPGTFIYRPVMFAPGAQADRLWHPVKPRRSRPVQLAKRAYARGIGVCRNRLGKLISRD